MEMFVLLIVGLLFTLLLLAIDPYKFIRNDFMWGGLIGNSVIITLFLVFQTVVVLVTSGILPQIGANFWTGAFLNCLVTTLTHFFICHLAQLGQGSYLRSNHE